MAQKLSVMARTEDLIPLLGELPPDELKAFVQLVEQSFGSQSDKAAAVRREVARLASPSPESEVAKGRERRLKVLIESGVTCEDLFRGGATPETIRLARQLGAKPRWPRVQSGAFNVFGKKPQE